MVRKKTSEISKDQDLKKEKKLSLFSQIAAKSEKDFGVYLTDYSKGKFTKSIPTGIDELDQDLNYGEGIPLGIMCEFFGKESGGKSYFAQKICANAQRKYPDMAVIYVDLENSLMERRLKEIGVDTSQDRWIEIPNVGDADKTFDHLTSILEEFGEQISLVVIDSLKAITKPEWIGDKKPGSPLSKFLSNRIGQLHALCVKHEIACILINQVRIDIAAAMNGYYAEWTPGGDTVNFFAQLRLRIKKVTGKNGLITIDNKVVGHLMEIKNIKSKIGIPLREYKSALYYVHVALEDKLFILGREHSTEEGSTKKIISVRNDIFKFKEHTQEGEMQFKRSLFNDNLLIDLYDELALVCDVDGISRQEVIEHYEHGPDETNLKDAMSQEEYERKMEEEEVKEKMDLERQKSFYLNRSNTELDPDNIIKA